MDSNALDIIDLCSAQLVGILNRTFTNLLIEDRHVYIILYSLFVGGSCIILIAFVSVLISLYKCRNSYRFT